MLAKEGREGRGKGSQVGRVVTEGLPDPAATPVLSSGTIEGDLGHCPIWLWPANLFGPYSV